MGREFVLALYKTLLNSDNRGNLTRRVSFNVKVFAIAMTEAIKVKRDLYFPFVITQS